jgi:hypothetical protein
MTKYVLIFAGIFTMCVPDDASLVQFALQGALGLGLFITGMVMNLNEQTQ